MAFCWGVYTCEFMSIHPRDQECVINVTLLLKCHMNSNNSKKKEQQWLQHSLYIVEPEQQICVYFCRIKQNKKNRQICYSHANFGIKNEKNQKRTEKKQQHKKFGAAWNSFMPPNHLNNVFTKGSTMLNAFLHANHQKSPSQFRLLCWVKLLLKCYAKTLAL